MRRSLLLLLSPLLVLSACSTGGGEADDLPSAAVTRHVDDSTPASCDELGVASGAVVDGADLLTCLEDSLRATRSGLLVANPRPQDEGETDVLKFVHDGDDLVLGHDRPGAYVIAGGRAWADVDDDGTWVESVADGSADEQRAAEVVPLPDAALDSLVLTGQNMPGTVWDVRPASSDDRALSAADSISWRLTVRPDSGARAVDEHVVLLDEHLAPVRIWIRGTSDGAPVDLSYGYGSRGEPMELVVPE